MIGEWHGTFDEAVNASVVGEISDLSVCQTQSGTSDPTVEVPYNAESSSFYLLLPSGEVVVSDQHRMARGDFWHEEEV
jgi:hypothetical protein